MKDKLNILFPGSFKPVHAGHMSLIDMYLKGDDQHDTQVYVLISGKDRDGITALSTLKFLNKIFGRFPNFHAIVTNESPVKAAYDLTATKEFGDGCYALAASTKESDVKRALDYNKCFISTGKYYTPGVKPLLLIPDALPVYVNRKDEYNDSPISASIVRKDIMRDDYNAFLSAYETPFLPDYVTEKDLIEYYNELLPLVKVPINEGGAAGHINHPYDDNSLTFQDIMDMIQDLFSNNIEDITEKLDGINILASVDNMGRVVFARNKSHLLNTPMTIQDMLNNNTWKESTKNAFIKGAKTIEKVFNNLKDKVEFFNYDDKADGVKYRNWISIEIIDHDNTNVIPYVENFVSFHKSILTACTKYFPKEDYEQTTFSDPNKETDLYKLEQAIKKTNLNDDEFGARMTPKMIFMSDVDSSRVIADHRMDLEELMEEYDLSPNDTVGDYKYSAMYKYIRNNHPVKHLTVEEMKMLAERWSGRKNVKLSEFKYAPDGSKIEGGNNITISDIKKYEKDSLQKLQKRIMMPLDRFFINVGNSVLKVFKSDSNEGNESKVIEQIKKSVVDAISAIQETGDEKALDKLEYLLFRLGDTVDVNASEGIVFKYKGRMFKITGSFAVINQVINLSRKTEK